MGSVFSKNSSGRRRRPKITWYNRWYYRLRSRIRLLHTPLELRQSVTRLKHTNPHPYLALLRLFNPFPTWHFPLPEPCSLKELWDNDDLFSERRGDLTNLRCIPIWAMRDTPLRSLYRLYECMAAGNQTPMGFETEYFWYQNRRLWTPEGIPDPADPDPVRYAILACLTEELTKAMNWRLSLGMRRDGNHICRENDGGPYPPYTPMKCPDWTKHVPPVEKWMLDDLPPAVRDSDGRLILAKGGRSPGFAARNIVTYSGWLYTI